MEPILSMRHITKSFFGKPANEDVSMDVRPGEVHALLGENGAGKTTLMNILYGIYQPDSGEILLDGRPVSFHAPKDAIRHRIGMVHQHFTLVSNLTVSENITLGLKEKGYPFTDRAAINRHLLSISEKYGLKIDPDKKISSLSVGEEQRVEIMKLLYRDARILIFDEPTAVLTPGETEDFFRVLDRLRTDGKAILIITHHILEVLEIADAVTVLRDGRNAAFLTKEELTSEALSEAMIGRQLKPVSRPERTVREGEGLVLSHVTVETHRARLLSDVSLSVQPGEIVGIAGVDGNGQKELAEAVIGIRRAQEGTISLNGRKLDSMTVRSRREETGIGYISDDRHRDGLILDMNLMENFLLRPYRKPFLKGGFIRRGALQAETEHAVEEFQIRAHSLKTPVRLLSGGNQQKLILAREIHDRVQLVIALQPTRGLDIGASEFIREQLLSCRAAGACVLLISADLEEIFSISDRVAVMYGGRIMGTVENTPDVDMTGIGLMMAGKEAEL